jgi:hypothetical protein
MTIEEVQERSGESQITFWNAVKGKRYDWKDRHCTLKEIFYVVNRENVWGNVQATRVLSSTSFNLEDLKCWRPLLTPKLKDAFPRHQQTVQTDVCWENSPPRPAEAQRMEVEQYGCAIRDALEHWRSLEGRPTKFNESVNKKLYEVKHAKFIQHCEPAFSNRRPIPNSLLFEIGAG